MELFFPLNLCCVLCKQWGQQTGMGRAQIGKKGRLGGRGERRRRRRSWCSAEAVQTKCLLSTPVPSSVLLFLFFWSLPNTGALLFCSTQRRKIRCHHLNTKTPCSWEKRRRGRRRTRSGDPLLCLRRPHDTLSWLSSVDFLQSIRSVLIFWAIYLPFRSVLVNFDPKAAITKCTADNETK